ncbi:SDR family oxidoreductase [Herbiconiux sp. L3-i23]|uniref:SDR family oxidoreductase n=1 Tax=Herbiconiux sp. L3-i23 TaxID=2905871 RepID=UPI00206E4727|nr:SDR family NAD(P)-dependent oxidoreductase [Herbiconiux sp. L3-i23]BDI22937.1 short-chain dehydrogenase [Herbiconiux sp. L3-i23]
MTAGASSVSDLDPVPQNVAWVIGGGTGIGLGAARALARQGAHVVLSGRRTDVLESSAASIRAEGGSASIAVVDVADDASVAAAVRSIVDEYGEVDTLVFSAGTNVRSRFWQDLAPAEFASVVDVNLTGAVRAVQSVLPGMRRRGGGLVILVSSWAAWRYSPGAGAAYSASKTALGVLAETVNAEERGNGIRATHFCPGEVRTDILYTRPVVPTEEAMELMLTADDIGAAVDFVAALPPRVCVNELVITPTSNVNY